MSLPVVLRPAARAEFDEAFDWYEQQRAGLGVAFAEAVQAVLDRLATMPEALNVVFQDVRRAVVKRLPHSVFYRVEPDQVTVLAIFHNKRDPKVWQARA
jgi:plasmid stabilization system protein ParE